MIRCLLHDRPNRETNYWGREEPLTYVFIFDYLFDCAILVVALGIFDRHCNMQGLWLRHANSQLQHVGSSSLTRDRTLAPCIGSLESQPLDHQGGGPGIVTLSGSQLTEKMVDSCPERPILPELEFRVLLYQKGRESSQTLPGFISLYRDRGKFFCPAVIHRRPCQDVSCS